MVKKVLLSVAVITAFFLVASCSRVTDAKIAALEKSIDKLEDSYKDMTPKEIENTIELCDKQIKALHEKEEKLTSEQKNRIANLEGRFDRVLLKVELYLMVNDVLDESGVQSTIEYIKGLLGTN